LSFLDWNIPNTLFSKTSNNRQNYSSVYLNL
jgi:hypothetical protein